MDSSTGLLIRLYDWPMGFDRITVEPGKMGGRPCIRGMRITVRTVLGQLAAGRSVSEIVTDYPYLEPEDVTAALEYAMAMVDVGELPVTRPA